MSLLKKIDLMCIIQLILQRQMTWSTNMFASLFCNKQHNCHNRIFTSSPATPQTTEK